MKKRLVQYSSINCSPCNALEELILNTFKDSEHIEYRKLLVDEQKIDHLISLQVHSVPSLVVESDGKQKLVASGLDDCSAFVLKLASSL